MLDLRLVEIVTKRVDINGHSKMKTIVKKSIGGLWYAESEPEIISPLNRVVVVCIQGSGEFGSYSAPDMTAEVLNMVKRNGFYQDVANGEELPFHIISPLATKGKDIADHRLIASEIASIVMVMDVDYRFIGGLSFGGETTAGFLFQAQTGTQISQKTGSPYKHAEVFDGFFMLAGQAPLPTNPCAFPTKPVFMVHASGDNAIKPEQSFTMMRLLNECPERKDKIVSNYYQKWTSPVSYLPKTIEGDPINKLWIIPGGGHSTSWTEAYNWRGPVGTAGYEFRRWIERIAIPKKSVDIPGRLVLRDGRPFAIFEDGSERHLSSL